MQRAIVIGCPGSGKSTFARKLRDATELPLHYLDMLWHKPDRTNISREEFDLRLGELLSGDRWIIDGNYLRTLEARLIRSDTVFLMDFPLEVCLSGAKARVGKRHEDLPWVETELDPEFEQWIIEFADRSRPQIYELLGRYEKGRDIVIFKSREQADEYLQKAENY